MTKKRDEEPENKAAERLRQFDQARQPPPAQPLPSKEEGEEGCDPPITEETKPKQTPKTK